MCVKESDAPSGLVTVKFDDLVDSLYKFVPLEADNLVAAISKHLEKYEQYQDGVRRDVFVSLALRSLLETTYERAMNMENEEKEKEKFSTTNNNNKKNDIANVESLKEMVKVYFPKDCVLLEKCFAYADGEWTESDEIKLAVKESELEQSIALGLRDQIPDLRQSVLEIKRTRDRRQKANISKSKFVKSCMNMFNEDDPTAKRRRMLLRRMLRFC